MSMFSFYGFTPEKISAVNNELNNAFEDFESAFINVTQKQFVEEIANYWMCPEAVDYFRLAFKPSFDDLNNRALNLFKDVVDKMDAGAQRWAKITKRSCPKITYKVRKRQIQVAGIIKPSRADGGVGIDVVKSVPLTNVLSTKTYVKASTALAKIEVIANNSGFLGDTQEEALKKSLRRIRDSILDTISVLAKQVNTNVKTTAEKYKNTAKANVNEFSNIGGSVSNVASQLAAFGVQAVAAGAASVANTNNNLNDSSNYVGSKFEDGYQFGDVAKTVTAPVDNIISNTAENIKDTWEDGYQFGDVANTVTAPIKGAVEGVLETFGLKK